MFVLRSVKNGKTDTQTFSIGEFNTSSTTATATRNGTTHNHSLGRGSPVVGSRGALSRSLRLTVVQRRSPSSRRTMIIDRTNNQIKPSMSSTSLVTNTPRESNPNWDASRGEPNQPIQPTMPIGAAASAQMPRIFAREYCSLWISLGVPSTVGSPTPPRAICPSALILSILLPKPRSCQGKVVSCPRRSLPFILSSFFATTSLVAFAAGGGS